MALQLNFRNLVQNSDYIVSDRSRRGQSLRLGGFHSALTLCSKSSPHVGTEGIQSLLDRCLVLCMSLSFGKLQRHVIGIILVPSYVRYGMGEKQSCVSVGVCV
jgi:hypothetical protein